MNASSFRKQFQRVRQNIDQNLGRAEKTEVLSEEEQNLERHVELLKNICQNIQKKLQPCLRSLGLSTDPEKRMKKLPESSLSHALIECSVQLDPHTASGQVFQIVGDLEGKLAQEIFKLDIEIENKTLKMVQNILENDYPAIQKLKKQLNLKTLDMDAAKTRYLSALKQYQAGAGPMQKVDEAKVELDDAANKVDSIKDQLATEMYSFSAKETELNQCLYELVQIQAEFHRQSLTSLEKFMPQIQECINFRVQKPVFGLLLEEHVETRSKDIALVIEECIQFLFEHGLEEEGLFRLAGSSSKIKKLKSAFNSNISNGSIIGGVDEVDVHVIASVLKQYLRELPEPLMRCDLYADWMKATELPADQVANHLKEVSNKLPKIYHANLKYLIKFLKKLSENSDLNKMTPANIGLVMGPNLIWAPGDVGPNMLTTGLQSSLVEMLVIHANHVFPGEINFLSSIQSPNINYPINLLPALGQPDPSTMVKQPQYTILSSYSSTPDSKSSNSKTDPDSITTTTTTIMVTPQQQQQQQTSNNTMKKAKKQPAPQPPPTYPYEGPPSMTSSFQQQLQQQQPMGTQQQMTTSSIEYPPSPRIDKPRVPPPERPNVPPPDKPEKLGKPTMQAQNIYNNNNNSVNSSYVAAAATVAAAPPPAPGFIVPPQFPPPPHHHPLLPPPFPPTTTSQQQQQSFPEVAVLREQLQLQSSAINHAPQQRQFYNSNNGSSSSSSSGSSGNNKSSPGPAYLQQQQLAGFSQQQQPMPSVVTQTTSVTPSTPSSSGSAGSKPLYPYLGPSDTTNYNAFGNNNNTPTPIKTHNRNSSLGSKPPPPRPHPPVPPKKPME